MRGSIAQIQTNRELIRFENPDPLDLDSANLLHRRSPLRLERVVHWERIASRWRPAFSSHLVNAVTGKWHSTDYSSVLCRLHFGSFRKGEIQSLRTLCF